MNVEGTLRAASFIQAGSDSEALLRQGVLTSALQQKARREVNPVDIRSYESVVFGLGGDLLSLAALTQLSTLGLVSLVSVVGAGRADGRIMHLVDEALVCARALFYPCGERGQCCRRRPGCRPPRWGQG